ncbi:hypothetical protein NQ176_g2547 [Zarea fungicola]|uniref:Uncharacterized protein n=1 Tax=Zarea fungicola TaxID=93591 RepID=A0ACC1NP18_9HYPO|nr:hypothetical protein NQ176_g2547 [Lecanicillium fungicola]
MVSILADSFQYEALPGPSHIRLLKRLSPAEDGTLRFSLITQNIENDQREPYACLSYTWGNPFAHGNGFKSDFEAVANDYQEANKIPVLVNNKTMMIQKNLFEGLKAIPPDTYSAYAQQRLDATPGQSFIHHAAAKGHTADLKAWLRNGVDIDILDDDGHCPLHFAAGWNRPDCVKLLLSYGCRTDIRSAENKTPLEIAQGKGFKDVISLLENPASVEKLAVTESTPEMLLWADAMCINQADMIEKSAQVSMMDRIYSASAYAIAWLGPPDQYSEMGIKTLETLWKNLKAFKETTIAPFSGTDKVKYEEANIPYVSIPEWKALASIYQRQWSRRAWIVQEAVLARALLMYIGGSVVSFNKLGKVAEALTANESKTGSDFSTKYVPKNDVAVPIISNIRDMLAWRQYMANIRSNSEYADSCRKRFTLNSLIREFWTFMATDPRDKVFAHYGLLNLYAPQRQLTDYSLPVQSVYTAAARRIIIEQGDLHVLNLVTYQDRRRSGLPSWVPDFGLQGINPMPPSFKADEGYEYVPPVMDPRRMDDPKLTVQGVFMGKVSQTGGRTVSETRGKFDFDHSWLKIALSMCGKRTGKTDLVVSHDLWLTLCMNQTSEAATTEEPTLGRLDEHQGIQFRRFLVFMILAEADGWVREKNGLPRIGNKNDITFSFLDYDPFAEDLEPILADLDTIDEHDGGAWTPSRKEVLIAWNNYNLNFVRNVSVTEDGSPHDIYLPDGVTQENARPVGSGSIVLDSMPLLSCRGFISQYSAIYGGRQLITTNGDWFLGLASLAVKPGDEVWVVPGLNAPAVLRPRGLSDDGKRKRFEFMGACYMHGMMEGTISASLKNVQNVQDLELE